MACAAPVVGGVDPGPIDIQAVAEGRLYICNQGDATVAILDIATQEIVEIVDLKTMGFSVNAKPHHIAVEPDGSFWYLSLIGEGLVLKFNDSNELVARAEFEVPGMLVLHPTEDLLLVGRSMSAVNPPQRIGLIRRSDMHVDEIDVFFPRPHAIGVAPDGGRIYTASLASNQLGSLDLVTERLEVTLLDGPAHTLVQFAVSPDGRTLVATAQLTGKLFVFDLSDPDHPRVRAEVAVNDQPWHPVFTPDGRWVYFGNKTANTITIVDMVTRQVAAVLEGPGIAAPHGSAVSPDGRWVYISSNGVPLSTDPDAQPSATGGAPRGSVVIIDTQTQSVVRVIETGINTTGIAVGRVSGE